MSRYTYIIFRYASSKKSNGDTRIELKLQFDKRQKFRAPCRVPDFREQCGLIISLSARGPIQFGISKQCARHTKPDGAALSVSIGYPQIPASSPVSLCQ